MASRSQYPTVEYLRQCFRYEDGRLYWLNRPRDHFPSEHGWKVFLGKCAGKEAGTVGEFGIGTNKTKRHTIYLSGVGDFRKGHYYRYVIVWALHRGRWPDDLIDHEDNDHLNDRIDNLREADRSKNAANSKMRRNNTTGFKGVRPRPNGKFAAYITKNYKQIYLGDFDTVEEAGAAYKRAAEIHYGEFARAGEAGK